MMTSLNRSTASDPNNNNTTNMGATTTTTTTTTTSGKKKFGKNLNKLTKPPAPPAASETSKANAASRNGLLLLSTNKRNSGSGPSNGLLASKPSVAAPLPSLGLQYESTTSTHDVLLGAVVGAAASRAEQTPDAWGVAAAANNSSNNNNNNPNVVNGETEKPVKETPPHPPVESTTPSRDDATSMPSSNWDDYGGRGSTGRGLVGTERSPAVGNNDHSNGDSQQAYMASLARERAERRRQEEASRAQEQKEKAAQRLRALESKMEGSANSSDSNRKPILLEPLVGNSGAAGNVNTPVSSSRPTSQRTLFDPNRTYSSLVGGNAKEGRHSSNASGGASTGSRDEQGRGGELSPKANATPGAYSGPVIHLNSYEDRDRGEAPRAAAPRMLFDPKSGSMVAVPSRDDNPRGGKNSTSKRGGRRGNKQDNDENGRGKNSKAKNGKKGAKAAGKSSNKASKNSSVISDRKLPRTRGVLYARDDKGNFFCADGCDGDLGYGAHSVHGGRVRNPDAYAKFMDQQQQLYDDQLAPGEQRSLSAERFETFDNYDYGDNPYQATDDLGGLATGFSMSEQEEALPPLDWVKPNEKIELVTGMDEESPTLQATAREFAPSQAALAAAAQVAALPSLGSQDMDDDDDSDEGLPTKLEPRENPAANVLLSVKMSEDADEEDDVVPSFIGLGFDPTENMDSVIQSPSAKLDPTSAGSKELDGMDFGALSLEPPLCGIAANNHNHIFAFGSSATWGTGGDSNDWGAPMLAGSSNAGPIPGSRLFGGVLGATNVPSDAGEEEDHDDDAFLSLTTGIPGFLGTEDEGITGEIGGD